MSLFLTPSLTYNLAVPTPFNHVALALKVLGAPELDPAARHTLEVSRPAFLLGNTAPDYGTLIDLPRATGHFFEVPIRRPKPAHLRVLQLYPTLGRPSQLPAEQAAFLAGYLAHIWLDQLWILEVFGPVFGPDVQRGTFKQRLLAHNLLRAYLDRKDRLSLPRETSRWLHQANPASWLPFAEDQAIAAWRDHLASQLDPGGHSRTVSVFAQRHGISPSSFLAQLDSPEKMDEAIFSHLPESEIAGLFEGWIKDTIELVNFYLAGQLEEAPHVSRSLAEQARPTHASELSG